MSKSSTRGNCFMCGIAASKVAMKNHICKEHGSGEEMCYLVKAEGAYDKDYWLFFTVALDGTLNAVDNFLRGIWCECCGHMSAFRKGGCEIGKSKSLSAFSVGDKLMYEYDFGSTTEVLITIVSEISHTKQREEIQPLDLRPNEAFPPNIF